MPLTESIVEDAALTWCGELGYAVGHGPQMAPGEPAAEPESLGEVVQFRFAQPLTRPLPRGEENRKAIRRLHPAIPEEASACASHADWRATIRQYRIVRFERRINP